MDCEGVVGSRTGGAPRAPTRRRSSAPPGAHSPGGGTPPGGRAAPRSPTAQTPGAARSAGRRRGGGASASPRGTSCRACARRRSAARSTRRGLRRRCVGAAGDGAVVGARARRAADRPPRRHPVLSMPFFMSRTALVPRALRRAADARLRVAAEAVTAGSDLRARVAGAAERQRLAVVAVAAREELGPQVLARVEEVDVVEQRPRRRALAAEDHHPRGVDRRRRVPRPRRRRVASHREHAPRARRQVVVLERVVVERPAAPVRAACGAIRCSGCAEHVRRLRAPLVGHRLLAARTTPTRRRRGG